MELDEAKTWNLLWRLKQSFYLFHFQQKQLLNSALLETLLAKDHLVTYILGLVSCFHTKQRNQFVQRIETSLRAAGEIECFGQGIDVWHISSV